MPTALTSPDRLITAVEQGLRAVAAPPASTRPSPAAALPEPALSGDERRTSAALMRVNHAGEIAAQALYSGQSLFARSPATRELLANAAREERDHLAWCAARIEELGGRPSLLAPLWYAGSFGLGVLGVCAPTSRAWVSCERPSGKSKLTCAITCNAYPRMTTKARRYSHAWQKMKCITERRRRLPAAPSCRPRFAVA